MKATPNERMPGQSTAGKVTNDNDMTRFESAIPPSFLPSFLPSSETARRVLCSGEEREEINLFDTRLRAECVEETPNG